MAIEAVLALAAVVLDSLRIAGDAPCTRAGQKLAALEGDRVLHPPLEPFRHVEVVVARLVGDQVPRVDRTTEPLEGVVEAGEHLHVLDDRAVSDRRHRETVQLRVGRYLVARELDAHEAEDAAAVGVIGASAVVDRVRQVLRALEDHRHRPIDDAVAEEDQTAPVTRPPLAFGARGGEDDRRIGGALGDDLGAALDEEGGGDDVVVAHDRGPRLHRERRPVADADVAAQRVEGVGEERAIARDVAVHDRDAGAVFGGGHAHRRAEGALLARAQGGDAVAIGALRLQAGVVVAGARQRCEIAEVTTCRGALQKVLARRAGGVEGNAHLGRARRLRGQAGGRLEGRGYGVVVARGHHQRQRQHGQAGLPGRLESHDHRRKVDGVHRRSVTPTERERPVRYCSRVTSPCSMRCGASSRLLASIFAERVAESGNRRERSSEGRGFS